MNCVDVHPETEKTFKERPGLAILLTVIANKILEKEEKIKALRQSILEDIEKWEHQISLLEDFENRHIEELKSLYPEYLNPSHENARSYPFLMWPMNHLGNRINASRQLLDNHNNFYHDLKDLHAIPDGFSAPISMAVFEEVTGLSNKTIKDLIAELERRDLILRMRFRDGYGYSVKNQIYLERVRS
jgi:hypothetical protein